MTAITHFTNDNEFLSNFYPAQIRFDGLRFRSSEAAYQAMKSTDAAQREKFTSMAALESKRAGKKLTLRPDWESVKFSIMEDILRVKFAIPNLRQRLLDTGDVELVEENWWHDKIWGVCSCSKCGNKGSNNLGKILMKIRKDCRG